MVLREINLECSPKKGCLKIRRAIRKDLMPHVKEQVDLLKEWQKRMDYFYGGKTDEDFKALIKHYSRCHRCGEKIHNSVLIDLYFSKDPKKVHIREGLLKLASETIPEKLRSRVGILCCKCYKKVHLSESQP